MLAECTEVGAGGLPIEWRGDPFAVALEAIGPEANWSVSVIAPGSRTLRWTIERQISIPWSREAAIGTRTSRGFG